MIALVTTRIIEPRLGTWDRGLADEEELAREEGPGVDPALEAKGLRWAGLAVLAVLAVIAALTLPPGAPLRNPETGDIIGDSPFMSSLIVIISAAFLAAGIAYGRAVGTVKGTDDVLGMITKSWASLVSLIFLFLLIAQFIAYFDFSNMAQVAAVWLGDILEDLDLGDLWLLLGVIVVTLIVDFLIPAKIAKWAILAPIFVPLMLRLGIEPQTVLAAYRVGDSPVERPHAADALLRAHGRLRAALPEGRRHRDGDRADDAVRARRRGRLDAVLRRAGTRSASRSGRGGRCADARVDDATITLLVLAAAVALFVWNRLPVAVVALGAALGALRGGGAVAGGGGRGLRRSHGPVHRLAVRGQRGARRQRRDDVGGPAAGARGARGADAARRLRPAAVRGAVGGDHPERRDRRAAADDGRDRRADRAPDRPSC